MTASMASQFFIFFFFFLSFSDAILSVSGESYGYARNLDRKLFSPKKEKLSHFRLFWHDIYSGSKPTVVAVVPQQTNSSTLFGSVCVMDDPLTEGPDLSSKLVGKAQGFYSSAGQEEVGLLMVMNFVFMEGKYNGSTITILGRNKVFSPVREMPVIGGSGFFRYARGYVEARTHFYNNVTGDATIEYNIYVMHY